LTTAFDLGYYFPVRKTTLRRIREARGFDLNDGAQKTAVTPSWLSKLERRRATLDVAFLARARRAYGMSAAEVADVLDEYEADQAEGAELPEVSP
jgi:transcriptional regulator with XRE-family HTH domain